jgi:hypothetical protein
MHDTAHAERAVAIGTLGVSREVACGVGIDERPAVA